MQRSGTSDGTHFTLGPVQPVLDEGVKIPTSWNVETKTLGAPINSQNGQNVSKKLVGSFVIVLTVTCLPRTPCECKALAGKRIAACFFHSLHHSSNGSCRFLHCCHVRLFDLIFHEVFGGVQRRWQAFANGLGSPPFPVFWPVIHIITGCLLLGVYICLMQV